MKRHIPVYMRQAHRQQQLQEFYLLLIIVCVIGVTARYIIVLLLDLFG